MNNKNIENFVQKAIYPDLMKGRPKWDLEHTQAVVHHVKEILKEYPNLDKIVLIIAAYAHDWGYAELFDTSKRLSLDDIRAFKTKHMEVGAEKIKNLLHSDKVFEQLTKAQIDRIVHLVSVHDLVGQLKDTDELVLMEADTLGALDISFVKPTFDLASNKKYIESTQSGRISKFITPKAKAIAIDLIEKRNKYYTENEII